jgi:UDP-N-acetylmuramyl-tripeptide synthetase
MMNEPVRGFDDGAPRQDRAALRRLGSPAQAAHWLRERVSGSLCADSRKLAAGDGFLAWPGAASDARRHVRDALAAGASACLVEAQGAESFGFEAEIGPDGRASVASYLALKQHAGPIASAYFDTPSAQLDTLAVTGTNGKTSTAWWLAQALSGASAGRAGPCAVIGTLGIGRPPLVAASGLTSPEPVLLHRSLRQFVDQGLSACAIEASSVGLAERRLDGLCVKVAVFTNFTQDHLDYHGSMERYWQAKAELFHWPGLAAAVVNLDDAKGQALAAELAGSGVDLWTYSCAGPARLQASAVSHAPEGLRFTVSEGTQDCELRTVLAGQFNVSNLLAVLATLRALGLPLERALSACEALEPVPGRMEWVREEGQPLAVVDYAHTPDALEKVLAGLRPTAEQRGGRLWCVFGCGGNRDAFKRPLMAAAAAALADQVVVTSDNPRLEPAHSIIVQIAQGFTPAQMARVRIQSDRALAIEQTLMLAEPADVVLLAGKGHEPYQEIGDQRIAFSDRVFAALALRKRRNAQEALR